MYNFINAALLALRITSTFDNKQQETYQSPNAMTSKLTLNSTIKLAGGVEIPVLGFGVYRSPPEITSNSVKVALETGYTHIDTAQLYQNEQQVGLAISSFTKTSSKSLKRENIFVTTKLRDQYRDSKSISTKLAESVEKIGLGYVDLFLIHSPLAGPEGRALQWKELEELKKSGKTRAIGVSNYGVKHLEEMKTYMTEFPAVNQIELHPWGQQTAIVKYCRENNIAIEAYSPLVQGSKSNDPTLLAISSEVGKSWAQVLIRWSLQQGFIPLPKSDTESRILSNSEVFGWELSEEQMGRLNALNEDLHVCWNPTECA